LPLTQPQEKRYDAGSELYKSICVGCHQAMDRCRAAAGPRWAYAGWPRRTV